MDKWCFDLRLDFPDAHSNLNSCQTLLVMVLLDSVNLLPDQELTILCHKVLCQNPQKNIQQKKLIFLY